MKKQRMVVGAGCFWGVQYYFDQVPGVMTTTAGYAGGVVPHPAYDAVATGQTGHAESVQIEFDASRISYDDMLRHFFRLHDPTQHNRQGPDIGPQYRSVVFYSTPDQQASAIRVRNVVQHRLGKPVATEIAPLNKFYAAEPYHQKFTERTGMGACHVPYEPLG